MNHLVSLRHWQELSEGRRDRERHFEIMPERGVVVEEGKPEAPTVAAPLDDGAFLYFVRTIPLEVGQTYEFDRYFRPDRNPVTIRVLRREHIAYRREFDAVSQPIIRRRASFRKADALKSGSTTQSHHAADEIAAAVRSLNIGPLSAEARAGGGCGTHAPGSLP